ncbi:MAG: histone deacetylase family protein [Pseudomonadota bacterium]|nr:histone deacetylase family protein [Pseudomonadota bacterium]
MATFLYTHESCIGHDPGPMHPESPARLEAVTKALATDEFTELMRQEAPQANIEQIARIHPREIVEQILNAVPSDGHVMIDGDTNMSPQSGEASLRGVGALCAAVDAVSSGQADNAFCAIRPPGHHAEPERSMGFCIFNNVAAGAEHARQAQGVERVAVVDFDVHHGNGTQAMFWKDANLFFASTHQMPLYPGSGAESERGAHGNIVNVPLAPYSDGEAFRAGIGERIIPALKDFKPEFLFISAGFDAHADDPLAQINLVEDDYAWATAELLGVAADICDGRVVSTLEGGYNLDALAKCVATHVRVMARN